MAIVQGLLSLDLTHWPAFFPLIVLCGGLAGLVVNFTLSRRFVFASDNRSAPRQLLTFSLVALTTIGLRLVVAYALMALLTLPLFAPIGLLPIAAPFERIAHLGAVGLVTIYSFLAHKHVTFAGGFLKRLPGRAAPMVH